MTHHEDSQCRTHAEQYKSVLVVGVLRIVDQKTVFVRERGLRFLERDPVLAPVGRVLPPIPLEPELAHTDIVCTCKSGSPWDGRDNRLAADRTTDHEVGSGRSALCRESETLMR